MKIKKDRLQKSILTLFLTTIFVPSYVCASSLIISQPGKYTIGTNIAYTPAGADNIIYINTSNVVLDLNNNIISQSGGTGTLYGIEVAQGIQNITIKNGVVQGTSGAGIYINSGCNNITISNIQTYTTNQGIVLNGTNTNSISNCKIQDVTARYTTNQGIVVNHAGLVDLQNIIVDTCATTTFAIQFLSNQQSGISCNNIIINKCGLGIQIFGYQDAFLNNCRVYQSTYTGAFKGFYIVGSTNNLNQDIILQDCIVDLCTSTGACTCFDIENTQNSKFTNCIASNSTGTSDPVYGFYVGQTQNSILENCTVGSITTSGSQCSSFYINNSSTITVNSCTSFGSGQTGNGLGAFHTTSNVSNCTLINCLVDGVNSGASNMPGFFFDGPFGTINNIIAQDCTVITDSANAGFSVTSWGAILENNTVFVSNHPCRIPGSAEAIIGNIFQSPVTNGLYCDSGSSSILVKSCMTTNSTGIGFEMASGSSFNLIEGCTTLLARIGYSIDNVSDTNFFYNNTAIQSSSGNNYVNISNVVLPSATVSLAANLSST